MEGKAGYEKWRLALFIFSFSGVPLSSNAQQILKEYDTPGALSRDLAWDGQCIWYADAGKDSIFQITPDSGQVIHAISFTFNPSLGGGIIRSGGETLSVAGSSGFHEVDASTGRTLACLDCRLEARIPWV